MPNFIALFLTLAIVYAAAPSIRKFRRPFYATVLLISIVALAFPAFPGAFLINGGYEGLSLWIIVMFVGIKNPFKTMSKKIRLVRAELSIAAFIFTFSHFIFDFMLDFELSIVTGILSVLIMIPLFATSFNAIRKRIKGASWKNLHRLAYSAYILMFLHVILVTGDPAHLVYYSTVLFAYLFFKLKPSTLSLSLLKYGFLAAILLHMALSPLLNLLISEKHEDTIDNPSIFTSENIYRDGTYTGIADGYGPDLTVEVTAENNLISNIEILSHNERGSSFYAPAIKQIPAEIIKNQSISVDAVSGSTYTSYGIMNAVGDALSEAIESGSLSEIETPELSEKGNGNGKHRGNKQ
jgi:uncharacterized protein with FMN-binding domain